MPDPIAVFRYAGNKANGLASTSPTPHADTAKLCETARSMGWRVLKHRPFGEPQKGDHMDADTVADQIESGGTGLVVDFIHHADPTDLHYWGTVSSSDLAALWDMNPPEFYRRLALTCWVIREAGGTPVLDHAGTANPHPANAAWIEMVRAASGVEPILEPPRLLLTGAGRMVPELGMKENGFCLERWHYKKMIEAVPLLRDFDPDRLIRWWTDHKLADGSLPWGGNVAHWLRHVTSHGHTPAMSIEDIDLSVMADEFLDRVSAG